MNSIIYSWFFQNYLMVLYKGLAIAQLLLLYSRAVLTQCLYKDLYSVLLQKSLFTIFLRNAPLEFTHENIPQNVNGTVLSARPSYLQTYLPTDTPGSSVSPAPNP